LQTNITNGSTVAFVSGGDTYVFQDAGASDTVVQLVGVAATSVDNSGLAVGSLWIV
jgi:endonuclease YncB( thermonuclease family)